MTHTKSNTDSLIKKIIRAVTFILLLPITFLLLLTHVFLGTIVYTWLLIRFLVVYTFSVVRSAYLNKDVSNAYLVLIESIVYNYLRLYSHIIKIPMAVYRNPGNIRFEIESILERERNILSKNLLLNSLILFFIVFSLVIWIAGSLKSVMSIF